MKRQEWRAIAFKRDNFQGWQVNVFVHENHATNGDPATRETASPDYSPKKQNGLTDKRKRI